MRMAAIPLRPIYSVWYCWCKRQYKVDLWCNEKTGIKVDGDEVYEEFQRIYDEGVNRDADKEKVEDKKWNRER